MGLPMFKLPSVLDPRRQTRAPLSLTATFLRLRRRLRLQRHLRLRQQPTATSTPTAYSNGYVYTDGNGYVYTDSNGYAYSTATATATATPTPTPTPPGRISQITPTGTTCNQFRDGIAATLANLNYSVAGGKIKQQRHPRCVLLLGGGDGASREQHRYDHSNDHDGQLHRLIQLREREQCV